MDGYVRTAVKSELNRLSPAPRTARVVSIHERHCMVTYTGESTVVKVPYNNLAPSYEGQVVLIDGPAGDRRIVEVMGRTSIESRIDDTESFQFSPPLWWASMMTYPETYPVVMTNSSVDLGTTWVNATPMLAPRDMEVSRLEMRIVTAVTNSNIRMSLYRINEMFTQLIHVQSATVSGDTLVPAFNLTTPLSVKRDEVLCAVVSRVSGGSSGVVKMHGLAHPEMPTSRTGQFTMGNFNPSYQGNDVDSSLISPVNNRFHLWAAALDYVP